VAAVVAVVLVASGIAGVVWWRHAHRSGLAAALRLVPGNVQRYSWTDWAGVRRAVHVSDRDDPSAGQVDAFLDKGFDADLTSASAMVTSADALQAHLGFSPATVDWELFAQSTAGAVVVVQPSSTDGLDRALERTGYTEGSHGIWDGADVAVGLGVTPEFGHLTVSDGRIYASDSRDYLRTVLDGDGSPGDSVDSVARAVGDPVSAVVYSGDYVCGHLAMSQADDVDQAQAEELIRQAGDVDPLSAFAMAAGADRDVTVALGFDSHDRAVANADSRAALASGPAPGQGGDFGDRFRLGKVEADGRVVTMRLHPVKGAYVLSDLSTGPVLFASC
jgi:hypothetical protein